MGSRSGGIAERAADLRQASFIEPTVHHTAIDSPTIGTQFASPDVMVAAFVMKHEHAHGFGLTPQQCWIENQQAGVGYR
jgi:hypothetical protein